MIPKACRPLFDGLMGVLMHAADVYVHKPGDDLSGVDPGPVYSSGNRWYFITGPALVVQGSRSSKVIVSIV